MSSSEPSSYVWRAQRPAARQTLSLVLLAFAALAAALIFVKNPGSPLSLAPLLVFAAWRLLPLLGEKADQHIFIGFLILCFGIDDMSQVPWGRQLDIFTEEIGVILFKSYGLTGMEFFALGFSFWLLLVRSRQQPLIWVRQGLLTLLGLSAAIFLTSTLAGIYGLATGASIQTYLIQTRFLHALPLWTFIGFVLMRDHRFAERAIFWITLMVALKSVQAIAVYLMHRDIFAEAEYLVDHYFSAFSVVAMVAMSYYLCTQKYWGLRLLNALGILATLTTYILNDRRTSFVGFALALMILPGLIPSAWLRRYIPRLMILGAMGIAFVGATWNMPAPIGFVGATIKSFGQEDGSEGPSYRDLENANLFNAAASSPLTGIGLGKEFEEAYPMPDISFVYARYRMLPHNLFLAAWGFGGPLTMAATSLIFVSMIWLAGRMLRTADRSPLFFVGLVALFYGLQYFSYTFGDIGLQINRNQMLAGIFLGGCFRLLKTYLPAGET